MLIIALTYLYMCINPFMPNDHFDLNSLDRFISYIEGVWLVFIITIFVGIFQLNANRVDPDQTPQNAASDKGILCLPMSLLRDARYKWVNWTDNKILINLLI